MLSEVTEKIYYKKILQAAVDWKSRQKTHKISAKACLNG